MTAGAMTLTFASAITYLLPGVLAQMAVDDAGILVQMVEVETPHGLPLLKNGEIDVLLAYRYLPEDPPSDDEDWAVASLGREALVLVTSGHQEERSLEDCLTRSWVRLPRRAASPHWSTGPSSVYASRSRRPSCRPCVASES